MPDWDDNLTKYDLSEIKQMQSENRARGKELRQNIRDIVARRLAKIMTKDEYTTARMRLIDERNECMRRESVLSAAIARARLAQPQTVSSIH